MQSFIVSKCNLAKRLKIGGESKRDTSHDNKRKQFHKLSRQIHGVIASYLEYKEIIRASVVCRGGGFFQGAKPINFINPLHFNNIPTESDTHEEWVNFLFRELRDRRKYDLLNKDLHMALGYLNQRHPTYQNDDLVVRELVGLPYAIIFSIGTVIVKETVSTPSISIPTSLLTTLFLYLYYRLETMCREVSESYDDDYGRKDIRRSLSIVEKRRDILNQFSNIFRQMLIEKGIDFSAREWGLFSWETLRWLFILLSNQNLKELEIEIDDRTKQELIYCCIKFCDVKVGSGHLINRFLQLINQMQWDLNKDFRRNYLLPVADFQSAISKYFPIKTELQKSLLSDFLNFLTTEKNTNEFGIRVKR